MRIDDFLYVMQKVTSFKQRLEQEGITGEIQNIILKVYISDITSRINITMLEVM